jgi:transcriptional regulator with XRE-family HTH domain
VKSISSKAQAFTTALAVAIKETRESKKLSKTELAALSGLSQPYIGLIENGQRCPSADSLKRIALALEVSLAELVARAEKQA